MSIRVVHEFVRQQYLRTVVSIEVDGLWLEAAEAVETLTTPVYVITAWNPHGRRVDAAKNERRQRRLFEQLTKEGVEVRPALGTSPDGQWAEPSWAVVGSALKPVRRLAQKWKQDAIFELTATEQRVIGCASRWTRSRPLLPVVGESAPDPGVDLAGAVGAILGIEIEQRADGDASRQLGWGHDGDLRLPCPRCAATVHLFGLDRRSTRQVWSRDRAFVCATHGRVRLAKPVSADYRAVADAWRSLTLASGDADAEGLVDREYWAYVIELDDDAGDRAASVHPWVYVGETGRTPEERFAQHRAGVKASASVKKHGVELRPDLYRDQPPLRTRSESEAYEAWLFAYLKATGYPVKGGT